MSHKQNAQAHLREAERLQERLDYIEERAMERVRGTNLHLVKALDADPSDLAAKNELAYQVGLRMEKYTHVTKNMAGSRERHLQWAQTYGIMALLEQVSEVAEPQNWLPRTGTP